MSVSWSPDYKSGPVLGPVVAVHATKPSADDVREFTEKMRAIYANEEDSGFDHESAHGKADALMESKLIELGYGEAIAFLREQTRWYA